MALYLQVVLKMFMGVELALKIKVLEIMLLEFVSAVV